MVKIKLQQKKGFLIRDFVIAGILFGLVLALFVFAIADTSNNYSNIPGVNHEVVSPSFANHYSQFDSIINKANAMTSAVQGSGGLSLIGTFDVAFNSVFTVIKLIWDTVLIYTNLAKWIPQDFTFISASPVTLFLSAMLGIISIYLIFVWLSSIMRGKI
jgi:hypothetical protein